MIERDRLALDAYRRERAYQEAFYSDSLRRSREIARDACLAAELRSRELDLSLARARSCDRLAVET